MVLQAYFNDLSQAPRTKSKSMVRMRLHRQTGRRLQECRISVRCSRAVNASHLSSSSTSACQDGSACICQFNICHCACHAAGEAIVKQRRSDIAESKNESFTADTAAGGEEEEEEVVFATVSGEAVREADEECGGSVAITVNETAVKNSVSQ